MKFTRFQKLCSTVQLLTAVPTFNIGTYDNRYFLRIFVCKAFKFEIKIPLGGTFAISRNVELLDSKAIFSFFRNCCMLYHISDSFLLATQSSPPPTTHTHTHHTRTHAHTITTTPALPPQYVKQPSVYDGMDPLPALPSQASTRKAKKNVDDAGGLRRLLKQTFINTLEVRYRLLNYNSSEDGVRRKSRG